MKGGSGFRGLCLRVWVAIVCNVAMLHVFLIAGSASATITLNWTPPTTNTDGSALTDLQGYNVYYGSGSPCSFVNTLNVGNVLTYQLNLLNGTYCFAVTAYDISGYESDYSNIVYKTETAADTIAPTITNFTVPTTSTSLTVFINVFTATDNVGVTGYMVNESATTPLATDTGWFATAPISYTFTTTGSKTLYAWVEDAAGNVSTSKNATVTVGNISTTTISMLPINDTFINLDSNNNSASETLNTYTWPNDKIANSVLMKFDLSSIPAGAIVQSATLNLYLVDADTDAAYPTYNLSLNRIINHNPDFSTSDGYTYDGTNSWTPNSVCYNNIPLAQADISPVYDTTAVDKTGSFKSWNATQLVADWLANPSLNYGLMINADATKVADTYRTFASSKHPNSSYHPYLAITYIGNPPVCNNQNFKIGESSYPYQSIQTVCDGLSTGEILELQAITFSGDLTLQQNISITIQGGYNCDFSSNSGYTVIHSTLTIKDGSLTAANLMIQ